MVYIIIQELITLNQCFRIVSTIKLIQYKKCRHLNQRKFYKIYSKIIIISIFSTYAGNFQPITNCGSEELKVN